MDFEILESRDIAASNFSLANQETLFLTPFH